MILERTPFGSGMGSEMGSGNGSFYRPATASSPASFALQRDNTHAGRVVVQPSNIKLTARLKSRRSVR